MMIMAQTLVAFPKVVLSQDRNKQLASKFFDAGFGYSVSISGDYLVVEGLKFDVGTNLR
ncbi:hypothetical protein [Spirochaeta cellobiosiphila]|uniref:hypothetical protein n=1 Tax=Spirochaeta cellobiosiphila TaxID=504483 RepID=UPI001B7F79D1|nr:hypothetical protein [Spirochaeta cellobiosiphila]